MAAQSGPDEPLAIDTRPPAGSSDPLPAATPPARVPWWPFLVYLAAWAGVTVAAGWQLDLDGGFGHASRPYAYAVLSGLLLTLFGPAVTFLVGLVSWLSAGRTERAGLLSTALLKGAIATLAGVALWLGMLVWTDATRLGTPW